MKYHIVGLLSLLTVGCGGGSDDNVCSGTVILAT